MSFGVYVHIPFCAHRCDYCDFATWTDRSHLMESYAKACIADIRRHFNTGEFPAASTVFFGGGTPSLVPAEQLCEILDAIPRAANAEVTVECNPESAEIEKLRAYRDAGVTRLSFGMQSAAPKVLATLGRRHQPDQLNTAVHNARDLGFSHINVDLIYGTAGESMADWEYSLKSAIELPVDHVSAYALTIEQGTPLARRIASGTANSPNDDDQAEKYELADAVLSAVGFEWYEISNWARPDGQCKHNVGYWRQDEYLGIGCAAHGHTDGTRWWNVRTPDRYIQGISENRSVQAGTETLDPVRREGERFALELRTSAGVLLTPSPVKSHWSLASSEVSAQLIDQCDFAFGLHSGKRKLVANELEELGLVRVEEGEIEGIRVFLTLEGRRLANEVTIRLLNGAELQAIA